MLPNTHHRTKNHLFARGPNQTLERKSTDTINTYCQTVNQLSKMTHNDQPALVHLKETDSIATHMMANKRISFLTSIDDDR